MDKRTRFAPSPTGFLHVGSARVALYCWLFAKKQKGQFILRIEDTDRERSTQEAVDVILESMDWLGLDWDEGPFYQTKRFDRYQEVVQQLLDSGHAYRCYCSKARLDALREDLMAKKEKPRYDGLCRDKVSEDKDAPHVIRFRNPQTGTVTFEDAIRGTVNIDNAELDDLIIVRTDGTPTYNFTVVVDDVDMKITEVIRGEDHIANTPRQINIMKALGAPIPTYAHLPMILGNDGKKLSKRHGAVSVMQYEEEGFLPEALLNYLVRLGWSHGDQEIFSMQELSEIFTLEAINKAASAFNQEKLVWLNQHYLKTLPSDHIAKVLAKYMDKLGIDTTSGPRLEDVVIMQRERAKTMVEMAEKSQYFYQDFDEIDPVAAKKHLRPIVLEPLQNVLKRFTDVQDWQAEPLHQIVLDVAEQFSLKLGKLAQPLRVAVTGNTNSPPIDGTLALIGRDRVLARLKHALSWIESRSTQTES